MCQLTPVVLQDGFGAVTAHVKVADVAVEPVRPVVDDLEALVDAVGLVAREVGAEGGGPDPEVASALPARDVHAGELHDQVWMEKLSNVEQKLAWSIIFRTVFDVSFGQSSVAC